MTGFDDIVLLAQAVTVIVVASVPLLAPRIAARRQAIAELMRQMDALWFRASRAFGEGYGNLSEQLSERSYADKWEQTYAVLRQARPYLSSTRYRRIHDFLCNLNKAFYSTTRKHVGWHQAFDVHGKVLTPEFSAIQGHLADRL